MTTESIPPAHKLNIVDVFAGVGGFTSGFRGISAGGRCEFVPRLMIDVDRSACRVAARNIPGVRCLVADVHTVSGGDIREKSGIGGDPVHVVLGGPPCQGFSFLGRRALEDPRNVHVVDFLRLVKEVRPLVAVMENVPLIKTSHGGAVIREIEEGLESIGYWHSSNILSANEFGIPQIRKRAIVIAYRGDFRSPPELPTPTHERIVAASGLNGAESRSRYEVGKLPYISVEEAIGDLPQLQAGEGEEVMPYRVAPFSDYQRASRVGSPAVFNHRARAHSKQFLQKISVISEGGRNQDLPVEERFSDNYFSQAYARLHRDGVSNTITTYFGNPGSGRFTHYRDLRSLTVREAARLQSFPDTFVFDGDLGTQMRHVGNAVPPMLARAIRDKIAEDLVSHLEDKPLASKAVRSPRSESSAERSRVMRAVPSKNTSGEMLLRKALSNAGIRGYRTHDARLPGNPDIVFGRWKVAVFVDDCFWHGCPKCYRDPATNKAYWQMKVQRNRDRDELVSVECKEAGWRVVRIWEHDIFHAADRVASRIGRIVEKCKLSVK